MHQEPGKQAHPASCQQLTREMAGTLSMAVKKRSSIGRCTSSWEYCVAAALTNSQAPLHLPAASRREALQSLLICVSQLDLSCAAVMSAAADRMACRTDICI